MGRVAAIGNGVTKFKPGDLVGVGCLVDSCRHCASCDEGLEQYCENGFTGTYGNEDKIGGTPHKMTFGGYADKITVDERFVLRIPGNLDLSAAALRWHHNLSPLKHWKVGPGQKVGVIGLGGLGHMGVKLAHAMGAHVVMITTSPEKGEDARRRRESDSDWLFHPLHDAILHTLPWSCARAGSSSMACSASAVLDGDAAASPMMNTKTPSGP